MDTRARRLRIGFISGLLLMASAVAVPIVVVTQATSSSSAQTQDEIIYNQKKSATYLLYQPVSGTSSTQTLVSGGGGCSNPSFGTNQLLSISASYNGGPATAGLYNLRTGVGCDSAPSDQAWSIQPNEDLTFTLGITGRLFASADISLENAGKVDATGNLVPYLNGAALTPIPFTVTAPSGNTPHDIVKSTGAVAGGFDRLDVVVATGVVSVVGPTSSVPAPIFYLMNQICGGSTINATTDGTVTASITAASGNTCKTYTDFSAGTANGSGFINFAPTSAQTTNQYTAHFDWGYVSPPCAPDSTTNPCPPITVSFDGGKTFASEEACVSAPAPDGTPWCVTNEQYQQTTHNGVAATHITEDWAGFGDPTWR